MLSFITKGFILGLSLGTSCLATCGPVFLPYLLRDKRRWLEGLRELGLFLGGRFAGYAIFGAVAGLFGMAIPDTYRVLLVDIAYVLLGAFLIYTTIVTSRKKELCPAHKAKSKFSSPLLLGLFTGLNLCPAFALAVGGAVDTGGPVGGVFLFTGFFFGTSLWFLPMFLLSGMSHLKAVRMIAKILAIVVGAYFLVQGLAGLRLDIPAHIKSDEVMNTEIFTFTDIDTIYILGEHSIEIEKHISTISDASFINIKHDNVQTIPSKSFGLMSPEPDSEKFLLENGCYFIVVDTNSIETLAPFLSEYYFKKRETQGFIFKL